MVTIDPQTKSGRPQPINPLHEVRDRQIEKNKPFLDRVRLGIRWIGLSFSGTKVADMMGVPKHVQAAFAENKKGFSKVGGGFNYEPDDVVESFRNPVMNPVVAFHEALFANGNKDKCRKDNPYRGKKVSVSEAYLFCGQVDEHGKLLRDPKIREAIGSNWPLDHKIMYVQGNDEYKKAANTAYMEHQVLPKVARESRAMREKIMSNLKEDGFFDGDEFGGVGGYDPNQYSEFAPLMGGPFYRQLYMYDFLKQIAYAFEAVNHNPLAKAIIEILVDYSLGRGFDMKIKDPQMAAAWSAFDEKYKITTNVRTTWGKEAETYGDFLLDTDIWKSVDPSTIWDIITDAEDIDDEYYYYQSYPTAYQMFTGFKVPQEPGSENAKASDYIVRQIPAIKMLHMKLNCMSNEKRGRSSIFSVLGWLKRVKDLYNAQVIREWLYSCFMWDVEINGSQSDINNYMAANNELPLPGSRHVHNAQVKMTPLPALETANKGGTGMGEELISFIAVALRIPTQFLNVVAKSGGGAGSRAGALTAAEPFTKKVEGIQARWESFLKDIFVKAMGQNGIQAKRSDVEVLFPSVSKDATADILKNLQLCEMQGWLDNQTAAEMAAKELNITEYNYRDVQARKQKLARAGIGGIDPTAPPSRFGNGNPQQPGAEGGEGGSVSPGGANPGGSEIHGTGAQNLKKQLTTL